MERKDIPEEELGWTQEVIIGSVLVMETEIDSDGNNIKPMNHYIVAKNKQLDEMIVLQQSRKTPYSKEYINDIIKNRHNL